MADRYASADQIIARAWPGLAEVFAAAIAALAASRLSR